MTRDRMRVNSNFKRFLVDRYEKRLMRDFSFPRAADTLRNELEELERKLKKLNGGKRYE